VAVPVYAFGPGAEQFTGFIENVEIAHRMMKLLNVAP
jgi:alkaline phosphatase